MGAIPNRLPGFQDVERDADARGAVRGGVGRADPAQLRLAPDRRCSTPWSAASCGALRHRREPGAVGGRPSTRATAPRGARPPRRAGHLPDADRRDGGRRAARAGAWCEAEGTVTNSERRVQRVRKALDPPGRGARRHLDPRAARRAARARLGRSDAPRRSGTSCARSRRCTRGMSYAAAGGARRASSGRAPTRTTRARRSCTAGCGRSRSRGRRRRSASSSTTRRSSARRRVSRSG